MNKYWIWFSMINKIGAKTQKDLLERYKTPEKIWRLTKDEIQKNNILDDNKINIIINEKYRQNLDNYIEYMEKNSIKMITIQDEKYPEKLRNIYDPPVVLYVKGNEKILQIP